MLKPSFYGEKSNKMKRINFDGLLFPKVCISFGASLFKDLPFVVIRQLLLQSFRVVCIFVYSCIVVSIGVDIGAGVGNVASF